MSILLLDKIRKVNKLLHTSTTTKFVFSDICKVISEVLDSNVIYISKSGKILGLWNRESEFQKDRIPAIEQYINVSLREHIDATLNETLLEILSTKENVNLETLGFDKNYVDGYVAIINPIDIAGKRLGTLFIYRNTKPYDIDDIILSEYGSTVVGLEMVRSVSDENDRDTRNKSVIESAYHSLSHSEKKAIKAILSQMDGTEGLVVASKIAKDADITRSVIVNALRKFESAGLIEAKSGGVKGTYIKIISENLYNQLIEFER